MDRQLEQRGQALIETTLTLILILSLVLIGTGIWRFQHSKPPAYREGEKFKLEPQWSDVMAELERLQKYHLPSQRTDQDGLVLEQTGQGWRFRGDLSKKNLLIFEREGRQRIFHRSGQNNYQGVQLCLENCSSLQKNILKESF